MSNPTAEAEQQPQYSIPIFINKQKFEVEHAEQTGASLKNLAGFPPKDVLFLQGSSTR